MAGSIRKSRVREIPLSKVKDDLSHLLREASVARIERSEIRGCPVGWTAVPGFRCDQSGLRVPAPPPPPLPPTRSALRRTQTRRSSPSERKRVGGVPSPAIAVADEVGPRPVATAPSQPRSLSPRRPIARRQNRGRD